jgi:hypothetical protein
MAARDDNGTAEGPENAEENNNNSLLVFSASSAPSAVECRHPGSPPAPRSMASSSDASSADFDTLAPATDTSAAP